jgi:hypothetical protein
MWPRNPREVHGNVFKDSTLIGLKEPAYGRPDFVLAGWTPKLD